jgi:hypothetical protein
MSRIEGHANPLQYATLGLEFAFVFLTLTGAGIWADVRLETLPALTLLGTTAGFAGALYRLLRSVRKARHFHEGRPPERQSKP